VSKVFARALLVAEAVEMVPGTTSPDKQGRWRLNAGSEMMVEIGGLNKDKPVRLVLDLATCKPKNPKITTLFDHEPNNIGGYWDGFGVDATGMAMDLHLIKLESDIEAAALPDVVRTHAMIRNGVPIQVSVGADAGEKGTWDKIEGKVTVNGREYDGAGDVPLYVLRNGEIFEASIVTFGADAKTGRLAAKSLTQPVEKGTTMSDMLKVFLGKYPEKHHGLVARCVAEGKDEINTANDITAKIHACEVEDLKASVAALEEENTGLKAKLHDYAQEGQEKNEEESEKKLAAKGSDKGIRFGSEGKGKDKSEAEPKTLTEAMKVVAKAKPELKGFALRKAARVAYPNAEEK
jgi:hypothetical protein